jgi:Dolichyl-phosphate-mannose-protein mannosyltransferase
MLALWSALAVAFFSAHGWLLNSGDAEAHLDIARRMVDSRTPGYDQVGTAWLPLEHWITVPFARVDAWWQSGIAGAIPSAICFVLGGCFLFAAARRIFQSQAAAWTATALVALNPNLLYLQSTAMTEAVFFACLTALLYFTVRFRESQGWLSVIGAGLAACAGTLTRYEGWFLLPAVALYFFWAAKQRRVVVAVLFCAVAGLGPLYWLFHNWWLNGAPLDFYNGPYSARAIQGDKPYPGRGEWGKALLFFRTAAQLCCGIGLVAAAAAGLLAALFKRAFWPLLLLLLPGLFYLWSLHAGAVPIFVPSLWYGSYYNTRYGLAVLPLLAVAAAALVCIVPAGRARIVTAVLVILGASVPWLLHPQPENWIVWQEANVNDQARREATHQAAEYLRGHYVRGSGIFTSFGTLTPIYRELGIPLRETFTGDNGLPWDAAAARPELVLRETWGVVVAGDTAEAAMLRAGSYSLEKSVLVKGAPEIRIYRRTGENRDFS